MGTNKNEKKEVTTDKIATDRDVQRVKLQLVAMVAELNGFQRQLYEISEFARSIEESIEFIPSEGNPVSLPQPIDEGMTCTHYDLDNGHDLGATERQLDRVIIKYEQVLAYQANLEAVEND